MIQTGGTSTRAGRQQSLVDENEQLRTALEAALEENAVLAEDRDRLRRRIGELGHELSITHAAMNRQANELPAAEEITRQSQAEEELRVAFEELQVLTEELEVANTSLHHTNQELDARVAERTRQLSEINNTLQTTEAAFRTVADLVPELLWRADRKGAADWFNQRWFDYTGLEPAESQAMGWLDAVHPLDQAVTRTSWAIAIASGKPYQQEHRIRDSAGGYRWFLVRAEPLRDEEGRVLRWFVAGTDIQDQRIALEALQQSELRFRTLIEGIPQLVWRAVDGGHWTWSSPQWSDYTGQNEEQARLLGWLDAYHPADRDAAIEAWKRAQCTGTLEIEGRIFHAAENRHRHFRTRALAVQDDRGRIVEWLGTSTDVDDLLQLQEQQAVLVAELQHRTRNLMAVVQSITMRTIKGSADLDGFRECISDRLAALARVQGLLSRRAEATRVTFDVLLREELSAHVTLDGEGNGDRVTTGGPAGVQLRSATVQTLALALHELATNATKYGALRDPDGHLSVRWRVEEADGAPRHLHVEWRETGVANMPDPAAGPRGSGYGRELIERALPFQLGARTEYVIASDGIQCAIDLPIPETEIARETQGG